MHSPQSMRVVCGIPCGFDMAVNYRAVPIDRQIKAADPSQDLDARVAARLSESTCRLSVLHLEPSKLQ